MGKECHSPCAPLFDRLQEVGSVLRVMPCFPKENSKFAFLGWVLQEMGWTVFQCWGRLLITKGEWYLRVGTDDVYRVQAANAAAYEGCD
eukprot:5869423-Amphidinium_carterae.1